MILARIIPSHTLAVELMMVIKKSLGFVDLDHDPLIAQVIYVAVIISVALAIGWFLRVILLAAARKIARLRQNKSAFVRDMLQERVMQHCSHIVPPLVMLALLPWGISRGSGLLHICMVVFQIYFTIAMAVAVNAVITLVWKRYDDRENTRNLPLKGILNTAKGIVWIICTIIAASILMDKSPVALLTGLGAFAAALMLIFKDSILGFVAGIQLSQNDMVHVGDWIVVPSTPANGVVLDISLTTVKVCNWDNTTVTLPPYTLVNSSFQNWRGMKDSGARRIMRSVTIETQSIQPLTPERAKEIAARLPLVAPFVSKASMEPVFDPGLATVNGTVDTNLGLMRAYLCAYILSHPAFDHNQQVLVRLLDPTSTGIPLQIWCFTSTTAFTAYEAIQSALFEHIAVVAQIFGLTIFNYPSNTDSDVIEVLDGPKAVNVPPTPTAPYTTETSGQSSAVGHQ